jgi:hypothetical protein
MSSLSLGVIGGAIGYYVGGAAGASIGFTIGSAIGGALFPPKGPDGPRLGDLTVQSSAYGQPIPIPYGSDRIAGNIIWAQKIQEHANEEGGKGGPTQTVFSYTCSFAAGVCEGPIAGILRIWADGLLIYDGSPTATGASEGFQAGSLKVYLGTEDQLPDPTIQALQGDTPAYRGLAYVVFTDLQLEKYGNRVPSLSFEYVTEGTALIPPTTTFGEAYGIAPGQPSHTFESAVDPDTGHVWLATMGGHAYHDPATGGWRIDPALVNPPVPQIQEYDPATQTLVWAANVGQDATGEYPIRGKALFANGYFYVGRGSSGTNVLSGVSCGDGTSGAIMNPYAHGVAVNVASRVLSHVVSGCSSGQFSNIFFWPSVPVIENGNLFFVGGNGVSGGLGIGFLPFEPFTEIPGASSHCTPCSVSFTGTKLTYPDWAFQSTFISQAVGTVVQGWADSGAGSYLAMRGGVVNLPGSATSPPKVAWDGPAETLWTFANAGGGGGNSTLYAVKYEGGALAATNTGFTFPVPGDMSGTDVKGITVDSGTGYLRLVVDGASDTWLALFDPIGKVVIESVQLSQGIQIVNGNLYDLPKQQKVIFANSYELYDIPYGSPLDSNAVNLAGVVRDISLRCGLEDADIDVSELTDLVDGFTLTRQMAGRSAIEPLMQAFFFDPVESDYKIKFRKRGRRPAVTIPDDDLAAHSAGSEVPDLVQIKRMQEIDLPQTVSVKFKNTAADYQNSTQYERRMAGRSQSDVTVELPLAMSPEKAKQIATAALYSAWSERTGLSFSTSLAYAALEPTDTAIVHNRLVRVAHRKRNGAVIEWEVFADGNSVYPSDTATQGGAAAPSGPVGQTITPTPVTQLVVIDAPITQDGVTGAVITFAVQGRSTGWNGAQIFKSVDGGLSYQPVASAPGASLIGSALNVLGPYQGGDTFDELNTVRVALLPSSSGATLSSATELAVLNGSNAALLGGEVLQYKRAVLNDDGTYTLSGLLRYRRGTDYATHAAGERFVPLTTALVQVAVPTSEVGLPRQYKAVSNGGSLSLAQAVTLTYTGADLKPYSPVQIGGWRDAAGGLTLTWTRRTRIGGEWRDGIDAPLSEAGEAYDIEILNGSAIARTFSGVTTPTVFYSTAQQIADFGSVQSSVTARIYQLSSAVGRGFPGTGSV